MTLPLQARTQLVVSRLEPCSIDVDALREQLARDDCGAVVIFEGRARASSQGRTVLALDYEAFDRVAVAQLADIAREVATDHGLGSVAAVHRVGRVAAGGIGVVVGAASPHSHEAFAAAAALLARVKTEVLIWKKEVFADGGEWVRAGRPSAAARATRLRLADGTELALDGDGLVAGGAAVPLSRRERKLIEALARRPGVPVPKESLLRQVWDGAGADDHVVEVTVARIRRKLGPAAGAVQTVPRRGYRLAAVDLGESPDG